MVVGSCGRAEGSAFPVHWASHKGTRRRSLGGLQGTNLVSFLLGVAGFAQCLFNRRFVETGPIKRS